MAASKHLTGRHRTVVLRPHQDDRLNQLLEQTGLNRNQLFRLVAEVMTSADVEALVSRRNQ